MEHLVDELYLDPLSNPPTGFRYHWRDGWFFQRTRLGAVVVTVPKIHGGGVKLIPPNEWASIVAHVSQHGENGQSFTEALTFHGKGALAFPPPLAAHKEP